MYKEVWEEGNCEGVFITPLISYTQYSQMNREETNIRYAFMGFHRGFFGGGEEVVYALQVWVEEGRGGA